MTALREAYLSLGQTFGWPGFLPQPPDVSLLDRIWIQPIRVFEGATGQHIRTKIAFDEEIVLSIPGVDAIALAIGLDPGGTVIPIEIGLEPDLAITLSGVPLTLRLKSELFKPVRQVADVAAGEAPRFEVDPDRSSVDIGLGHITAGVNGDGDISITATASIDLPPCMLGDSGVVIEARGINLHLDGTAAPLPGQPAGWRGVHIASASLHLPGELAATVGTLTLNDCTIGNGGFSGTVATNWAPPLNASLFGLQFTLASVALTFRQNALTAASITGTVLLPFFDTPLAVEICPNMNGPFTVRVASDTGLMTLRKEPVLELGVESVSFEIFEGVFTTKLSGTVRPLIPPLDWPTFDIRELAIDSRGNVRLDGGLLDLPQQYALDFHGFQVSITKLGFGKTEDGANWIACSGALRLVEGLSAGASVEGLRILWYPDNTTRVTLDGVGVELTVPNVIALRGAVAFREFRDENNAMVRQFDGRIRLEFMTLGLTLDATLVVGRADDPAGAYSFLAIYLDIDLPAGIPLFSTGLALYGMAGLFALNMEPKRSPEEPWFGITGADSWYHRPEVGVTDLATKWKNRSGSLALGAGITLGTVADNGYTFSGKMLLVIVLPGPIVMLEGKANILKPRSTLGGADPNFRALAVLDGRAGTFLIGVDARYKYADNGELIDIHGSVEAYFNVHDAGAWHFYLGLRNPRDRRIRAEIIQFFEANCYLMLDAHQLATGAWIGWDKTWDFGPLSVTVEAWIEGNAVLSWRPLHLHGDLWMHGRAELSVFGFGLGLSVDARFAADVFTPYHIFASFAVGISLPWPLPDFNVEISFEWGPEQNQPPIPLPLKEVAIEHLKVTESWPLPRTGANALLTPNYEGADGFRQNAGAVVEPPREAIPVVPLDCRPHITFGRSVHDLAKVGTNTNLVVPERERVGDPARNEGPVELTYSLNEIAIERKTATSPTGWAEVARSGTDANASGAPRLFGSWAPVPAMPDGGGAYVNQTKLWLWSKTPFDYTRHTSRSYEDWFGERFEEYPCPPPLPNVELCLDFESIPVRQTVFPPYTDPNEPGFRVDWVPREPLRVRELTPPVRGKSHALCLPTRRAVARYLFNIHPPEPAKEVRIVVWQAPPQPNRSCVDFAGYAIGVHPNPLITSGGTIVVRDANGKVLAENKVVAINVGQRRRAVLDGGYSFDITAPCSATSVELVISFGAGPPRVSAYDRAGKRVDDAVVPDDRNVPHTITLHGAIATVTVEASQNAVYIHRVCFVCAPVPSIIVANGVDDRGRAVGPAGPIDHLITLTAPAGSRIRDVEVSSNAPFCLLQVCVTIPPPPEIVTRREELIVHTRNETARLHEEGVILAPNTTYRIKIVTHVEMQGTFNAPFDQTEYAFFRTEGPPGLAALTNPAGGEPSALTTLTRYVQQTVPPTVGGPGTKALLPRPVYRAYDVGAAFNEDYVEQMYRLGGRDLGLYLFDNNNQPIRDARRRLAILPNLWGKSETLSGDRYFGNWITELSTSDCVPILGFESTYDSLLFTRGEQVLDPDRLYEARFVPLLAHEAFADLGLNAFASGDGARLGRWLVHDEGNVGIPSRWEVLQDGAPPAWYVVQTRNVSGGSADPRSPNKPGTVLVRAADPDLDPADPAQPAHWRDIRLSAQLRTESDGAIGLVFRRLSPTTYYRFSMERAGRYRRLVRMVNGTATTLAEDDFVIRANQDYLVAVQVIGSSIEIYLDGEPVFAVEDAAIAEGGIGLYAWSNAGARFSEVRVDDFRAAAAVPYRFRFITSRYTNFHAQIHSYDDETWPLVVPAAVALAPESGAAVLASMMPAEAEWRAFDSLAARVIPQGQPEPDRLRVTRLDRLGATACLVVDSPEPIDWARTSMTVSRATEDHGLRGVPAAMKMTGVAFGALRPNEESIDLLLRDVLNPDGVVIERRQFAGLPIGGASGSLLLVDDFSADDLGLPFHEAFGDSALGRYEIIDEGNILGPSHWTPAANEITQTSDIYGGSLAAAVLPKPGTMALTGRADWADVRIEAQMRSDDNDAIGLVFRYTDATHFYRFSLDSERTYRRLVKNVGGNFTVLWEDHVPYTVGAAFTVVILAAGDRLIGFIDGAQLFDIRDASIRAGRVGFYTWANNNARFQSLHVERLAAPLVVVEPEWDDLSGLTVITEQDATDGPAAWSAAGGIVRQTSNVHVVDATPHRPGTYAVLTAGVVSDAQISVRLRSTAATGALGVMFRYSGARNYYRFSMDEATRRLLRVSDGVATTLWADGNGYVQGREYAIAITAVGNRLRVFVDGVLVVSGTDSNVDAGGVALYSWANTGAEFRDLRILDLSRRAGAWTIRDSGTAGAPSVWRIAHGSLTQTAAVGGMAPFDATVALADADVPNDFVATVRMRPDTNDPIGVVFRYANGRNHYRFTLDNVAHRQRFEKVVAGVVTVLREDGTGFVPGDPLTLTIAAAGARFSVYRDGAFLFEVSDPDLASGRFGLLTAGSSGGRFERVEIRSAGVERYALFRDRFPENDMTSWATVDWPAAGVSAWAPFEGGVRQTSDIGEAPFTRASLPKRGTMLIAGSTAWTDIVFEATLRSLDDDTIGVVFRYADATHFYRFSMDRERTCRRLVKNIGGTFTLLWEDSVAYEEGRAYHLIVALAGSLIRIFLDGVPLCIVEDADIPAGAIGLCSWLDSDARFYDVSVAPLPRITTAPLLDDPLWTRILDRWTVIDQGNIDAPSQWLFDGRLRQTSTIRDGSAATAASKRGTMIVAGQDRWSDDYRLVVRMQSLLTGSLGILFRYVDATHYYLLLFDTPAGVTLVRRSAAAFDVLWRDAARVFVADHAYVVTIDCAGDQLTAYLDAERLFSVEDATYGSGKVGFFTWANASARFSELQVWPTEWVPHYAFGGETAMASGTRIRVFSGAAASAPPAIPAGVHPRFAAGIGERGRRRFLRGRADLRVRNVRGDLEHRRTFVSGPFPALMARVLRKRDGTAFFLFPPTGDASLTRGEHRLAFEYRRDNTARQPDSPILSQAGDREAESATIDVPWETIG